MAEPPMAVPGPPDPVADADRQVIVALLQQALARDVIPFEEADDRFAAVFTATNRGELDAVVADLPAPPPPEPEPPGHPLPATSMAVFGDCRISGPMTVEGDLTFLTVFGDVVVDLSAASLPDDLTITAWTVFGDITVIVADGDRASLATLRIFGDQRTGLVPVRPGASTVRVVTRSVFGNAKLYSLSQLPEGRLRALWRQLRRA